MPMGVTSQRIASSGMPWLRAARPSSSVPMPSSDAATRDGSLIGSSGDCSIGAHACGSSRSRPSLSSCRTPLDFTSTSTRMVECMSVTTEPPTVHRDDGAPLHGDPGSVSEAARRGCSTPRTAAVVLGVVGVVVALAFEAIAVATAMPVAARELGGVAVLRPGVLHLPDDQPAGHGHGRRGVRPAGTGRCPSSSASAIFAAGLAIAGAAPTMWVLVLARGVQGFGAGLNIVALYVVVARAFPDSLRPRVFSAMSSGWIVPALIGPPIAGLLADHVSWRWVFLGVLPLIVIATALVLPHLRGIDGASAQADARSARRPNAQPAPACPCCRSRHGTAAICGAAADLGVAAAAARRHRAAGAQRAPAAAARVRCVSLAGCRRSSYSAGCFAGAFFGAEVFVPLLLVEQRGLATTLAGASLTGGALTWSLGSWYQGRPGPAASPGRGW